MSSSQYTQHQIHSHQSELWKGQLPIQFDILPSETNTHAFETSPSLPQSTPTHHKVPPMYKMVPRIAYFGTFLDEILQHFQPYVKKESDGVWMEWNGEPLKWNAPVGVLYDYLCAWNDTERNETLPWRITVRFFAFPIDRVLELHSDEDFQWNYINNLKESIFVQYNNTNPIMTCLSKPQQNEMWNAIKQVDYDTFSTIYQHMIKEYDKFSSGNSASSDNARRRIPIKVYRVEQGTHVKREISNANQSVTSELHCLRHEDTLHMSLYDFFERNPEAFPMDRIDQVIIQGIHFSWENSEGEELLRMMNVFDVFRAFCHPDQLLYIVIVQEANKIAESQHKSDEEEQQQGEQSEPAHHEEQQQTETAQHVESKQKQDDDVPPQSYSPEAREE